MNKSYQPLVLADTANLARPDWLALRRQGLGGSDAAAVLSISPFRTARDLYYDKLGIVTADDQANWVALEVGNLLEPLVARIFEAKTGLKVYQRKCMFQHPLYPWMLADLDYLVDLPDGTTAIVEIKTTNYNAKDKWWYNGAEIVPVYYETQGRHYMTVMNLNRVYYCCLYGNNEDDVIIRHIDRDKDYESELIALEENFWMNHVQAKVLPPYVERDGELILDSLRRCLGPSIKDSLPVALTEAQSADLVRYWELQERKSALNAVAKAAEDEMALLKAHIATAMGRGVRAVYEDRQGTYTVTFNPSYKETILKDNLLRLKDDHPDIYAQYVTRSESRTFRVKFTAAEAAA